VVCKVHAWKEGIQLESETIAFVREHFPDIPVTKVVYEWVDNDINRSFLIMKRIRARTLEVAWPQLTQQQRLNIAKEVADHTATIASKTSDHLQTVSGCGVRIPSLMKGYDFHGPIPHWFPRTIGPPSSAELRAYWTKISSVPPPPLDDTFVLYHDDQGPTNILVSDDGDKLVAIIDWANASYMPKFWIATAPNTVGGFCVEVEGVYEKDWMVMLSDALKRKRFEDCRDEFRAWSDATAKYDTEDEKLEWKKAEESSKDQPYMFLPGDYYTVKD
jgi:hypothetical protein